VNVLLSNLALELMKLTSEVSIVALSLMMEIDRSTTRNIKALSRSPCLGSKDFTEDVRQNCCGCRLFFHHLVPFPAHYIPPVPNRQTRFPSSRLLDTFPLDFSSSTAAAAAVAKI
jgi:hypothetical protein